MKPWDEMTKQEQLEWYEQHAAEMTPEEAAAYVRGVAKDPEQLAKLRRMLAEYDATASTTPPATSPSS